MELGTAAIPKERYTSPEFMRLEWERVWKKCWLLGGLAADIPNPGDYLVTGIGRESILIVRQRDGSVKSFYNVCQHRGNLLARNDGGNVDTFKCTFHHWEYGLDGKIINIPDSGTFPQGPPCRGLPELPTGVWGGYVFYSLDRNVAPLAEYLGVIPEHLDPYELENSEIILDATVEWECNWKTSVDAFNESYHVQAVHPQALYYLDDLDLQIDLYERHSRYLVPFNTVSQRLGPLEAMPRAILDAVEKLAMDPALLKDVNPREARLVIQRWKRANAGKLGYDCSRLNDDQLTDDYHYFIFPNVTFNLLAEFGFLMRQRPHAIDPDRMYFDLLIFRRLPRGKAPRERAPHVHARHGEISLGEVVDQDAQAMPSVQRGMHSDGFSGLWLSEQELRIRHFHKTLDDYIYGPGKKPPGAL